MSMYRDFVADFACRTFKNLSKVCSFSDVDRGKGFEVTQLLNSFLGLLVFPQQEQCKRHQTGEEQRGYFTSYDYNNLPFPNKNIEVAYLNAVKDNSEYLTSGSPFQKMIRHLRNAVAHQSLQVDPLPGEGEVSEVIGFQFIDTDASNSIAFALSIENMYNILMGILYCITNDMKKMKEKEGLEDLKEGFPWEQARNVANKLKCELDIEGIRSYVDQRRA